MKSKISKKPAAKAKTAKALRDLPTGKNPSGGRRPGEEQKQK